MLRGLQVGFGELIPPSVLGEISARGVQLARIKPGPDAPTTAAIIRQILEWRMRPLLIVDRPEQVFWVPQHVTCDVELMNEPDIGTDTPDHRPVPVREYRELVQRFYGAVWSRWRDDQPMGAYVGSASNQTKAGLAWLSEVLEDMPLALRVSCHWYPHGKDAHGPHPGFPTRASERRAFLDVIGRRQYAITETGWSNATWSESCVLSIARYEMARWRDLGAHACVLYQLNDGPTDGALDRYGIRRSDGSYKPVAEIFRGVHA